MDIDNFLVLTYIIGCLLYLQLLVLSRRKRYKPWPRFLTLICNAADLKTLNSKCTQLVPFSKKSCAYRNFICLMFNKNRKPYSKTFTDAHILTCATFQTQPFCLVCFVICIHIHAVVYFSVIWIRINCTFKFKIKFHRSA